MPYVVERAFRSAGPRLQQAWPGHLAHLRSLSARGVLLGGGPAGKGNGDILLLAVSDEVSLHRALRADPLVRQGLVARTRIRSWQVAYGHEALTGRACGDFPPATADTADLLTPHESRIAGMVLTGMTNQQIAGRLNVSCRAVEQHLTRMYRKLSISRRAQLATALGTTVLRYGIPQEESLTA
ncbi:LuxR C-terminal-related transcriptional regulator [Streptomyces sp. NPDC047000]|uniref:helix-turn-helix transcriptional regulator n=1 Tax=Streptomyces sp. NPDC047000 TaxID=3155474 RepID=UPI0033E9EEA4